MKALLLNLYEIHNIREKVFENWIMKDSLVVLANKDGSIKTIFNVTKDDKENLFYDKVKKLDLISLVADNNKSIIKSADSNNKYSFMFKKEKLNDKLLDTYADALLKKLDVEIHSSIKKVIENLKKEKLFIEKEKDWVKIFIDEDIEKYELERKIYVDSLKIRAIFPNVENIKKKFLSKVSKLPSKNVQLAQGEELDKFMYLDKYFYLLFKMNQTNIFFNKDQYKTVSNQEIEKVEKLIGYYLKVNQSNGNGYLEEFSSVSKGQDFEIQIKPYFDTKLNEKMKYTKFLNLIYIHFRIDIVDKNSKNSNFLIIEKAINNYKKTGKRIDYISLKSKFKSLLEDHFFKVELDRHKFKEKINIYNTIYKTGGLSNMKDTSFKLGQIIRYLETKKANGFGDYRNQFRSLSFKVVKMNLESLLSYYSHNGLATAKHELLKADLREIFNEDDKLKVNNISLIQGYLEELSYGKDEVKKDD